MVALHLAPGSDYKDDIALGKCHPAPPGPLVSGQGQAVHSSLQSVGPQPPYARASLHGSGTGISPNMMIVFLV